jgi:hypothetical protein
VYIPTFLSVCSNEFTCRPSVLLKSNKRRVAVNMPCIIKTRSFVRSFLKVDKVLDSQSQQMLKMSSIRS